jgi:hypothetical protein
MDKNNKDMLTRSLKISNNSPVEHSKQNIGLGRMAQGICVLLIAALISACSAATSTPNQSISSPGAGVPQSTTTSAATLSATATSAPLPTATSVPSPIPTQASAPQPVASTSLDPGQLISSQEASDLTGASYGPCAESTTPEGLKTCTYGAQTSNIFTVELAQAPDVATAQADKAQFLADLQASLQQLTDQGFNVVQLPNFADGAVTGQISISAEGITVNGSAFGFLKGTTFVGFSSIVMGGAAPSTDALQAEATKVLTRLP